MSASEPFVAVNDALRPRSSHLATVASLVSSLEVLKNGISFVPPVPTKSFVIGSADARVVDVEAMSLRLMQLSGFG